MSDEKTPDDYEVGYGKPPKEAQFQKGISGNPKGRPKKIVDFDTELIKEVNSLITINDNGRRKSISKLQGIAKQLTNKALTGNISALRMLLTVCQPALERAALSQHSNPKAWKSTTTSGRFPRKNWRGFSGRNRETEAER
ncbi:MAG TPA: DUF5681 domain-containing protein [Edaphobacter sp.]|nr:DUF5681 domain-containing protein [Edaphobacter sp.]